MVGLLNTFLLLIYRNWLQAIRMC